MANPVVAITQVAALRGEDMRYRLRKYEMKIERTASIETVRLGGCQ